MRASIAHVDVREAKGLRPGGFGLLTVRSSVDELLYNEQRNEVVFVKYLETEPPAREPQRRTQHRDAHEHPRRGPHPGRQQKQP